MRNPGWACSLPNARRAGRGSGQAQAAHLQQAVALWPRMQQHLRAHRQRRHGLQVVLLHRPGDRQRACKGRARAAESESRV